MNFIFRKVAKSSRRNITDIVNKRVISVLSPSGSESIISEAHNEFKNGYFHIPDFLTKDALEKMKKQAAQLLLLENGTFRSTESYNVYLKDGASHLYQTSSKVILARDKIPEDSLLSKLYHSKEMINFLSRVVSNDRASISPLFPSGDDLGAFYLNYFFHGDSLGWHFDNSEFFINLVLGTSDQGGQFEFVPNLRTDTDKNITQVSKIVHGDDDFHIKTVPGLREGSLLLFRGKYSMHRVTQVLGMTPRVNAIFTYERKPDVKLQDYTKRKFFGRFE